jgi:ankyrin repeat protein
MMNTAFDTPEWKLGWQLFEAINNGDYEAAKMFLAFDNVDVNYTHDLSVTPLLCAIQQGWVDVTKVLLKKGAEVDGDSYAPGNTPLFVAAMIGDVRIARMLLKKGANPNVKDRSRETPLIAAVRWSDYPMAKLLLQYGADAHVKWHGTGLLDFKRVTWKQNWRLKRLIEEAMKKDTKEATHEDAQD